MTAAGTRSGPMRFGLLSPFTPDTVGDPVYLRAFAQAIEAAGAESYWTVEHILVAEDYEPRYPYSDDGHMPGGGIALMPDPLQVLGFVGAHTSRMRLGTSVVVAPQHPAVVLAKAVATLDVLSGGRVELGVGSGWQIEEYRAVGVPYEERGRRLDETITAMRACWGPNPASHDGTHISFAPSRVDPKPVQPGGVPVVIGGSSAVAARRAGRLGDGWFPYVVSPDDVAAGIDTIRASAEAAGRDPASIEITVWPGSWNFLRGTEPELLAEYAAVGVDRIVCSAAEIGSTDIDAAGSFVERMVALVESL